MKKSTRWILASVITAVISALAYYVVLPPLNFYSSAFWGALLFVIVVFGLVFSFLGAKEGLNKLFQGQLKKKKFKESNSYTKIFIIIAAIPVAVLIVGHLISSTFFNATAYANIITVPEAVFEEDMPENDLVTNIPLMDSESANIIGNRTLGALSDVVSQYQVNGSYAQINYQGTPKKVSTLEYVDFFKWLNNRNNGIPGYVMVDPVNSSADYIKFSTPIKYTDSAYFGDDLMRKLRFDYPTKIFGSIAFELDEAGNPYYIVSCMKPKIALFGGMDVNEVIIFNPCDGTSTLHALADTPSWVDNVFTGYLASQKYDWHGTLQNGFWNSVIGNKDCKVTTDDFGYIIIGDDVWFFTGVTSVSSDESNIGFIVSNARTGEYKFYPVIGAEEYSAMGAAQGEVQEKGYVASFPSLINVSGEATYIMVLKDANGIVKMHALVNVENYSIVATGTTQTDAKQAYIKLLMQEGIIKEEEAPSIISPEIETKSSTITVNEIRIITVDGNSVMYLTGDDGNLYKQNISADEALLLLKQNDRLTVNYHDTDVEKIRQIVSWSFAQAEGNS
ncbi:MAG: hypothetical protein E7670_02665 [Ruminococcaceae bacterium]|nr:hypothetical protein [Oscillospiraceae bacterium]